MSHSAGSLNGLLQKRGAYRMRFGAARADASAALSTNAPLHERFQACTDALVRHLDAAAARIWLVTGNRRALSIQANSGAPTTRGDYKPLIPVASPALRHIVEEGVPYLTQDAANDPYLQGLDWPSTDRIAYAGYPILADAQTVGVLAMFTRAAMSRSTLETLRAIADMLAHAIASVEGKTPLRQSELFRAEAQRLDSLLVIMRGAIGHGPAIRNPEMQVLRNRYDSLSRREHDVMDLVVIGHLNKQVAAELGISEITVKAHRGQVMRKMKAPSFADLVKIAVLLQLAPLP